MRLAISIALTVSTILVAAAGVGLESGTAKASTQCTGSPSINKVLVRNDVFSANTYICSGNYKLANQADGNIVIYNGAGAAIWASHTNFGLPNDAYMDPNGNFVQLRSGWSTNTAGNPGAYLCFQRDGNLVVYAPSGSFNCKGHALWASGT
jgi:hypothetical protein